MIEILPGIWRSSMPLRRDVQAFAAAGGRSIVDLTQRKRGVVERACAAFGVRYVKCSLPYDGGDVGAAASVVLAAARPVLFHCFHGRDRTGAVAALILEIHAASQSSSPN